MAFLRRYWWLGAVLALALAGAAALRHRGAPAATAATGAPIAPPSLSPTQLGLEMGGLQDQISNLAAQISSGFAGAQAPAQNPNANSVVDWSGSHLPPGLGPDWVEAGAGRRRTEAGGFPVQ